MTGYKKKLIEVALPLKEINAEAAREKSIRHGHPSTLHLWWSRKPLAAARAVLFAQLVDDPSAHPDRYPTTEEQDKRRQELHDLIAELVKWENSNNESVLRRAREEIWESCDGNPPPILDPFAGGGTIPLEAQRLGLEAHASDLNPVAVLINKALIEIPPKWKDQPPVFPGAAEQKMVWRGAEGLAEDVRRYGKWMRDEAEKRIGHLYPKAKLPPEYGGGEATVVAWIWARTVICPNPACGGAVPLVNKFWLGKKKGKERWVVPVVETGAKEVRFEIGGPKGTPREGTVGRTGAVCLLCNDTPVPLTYIRAEGKAKRMGAQMMAIACEGKGRRIYLPPDDEHIKAADVERPEGVPESELPEQALGFRVQGYGMTKYADLFTNRQLIALSSLFGLLREVREQISLDLGRRDRSYVDSVATYLALAVDRLTDSTSALSRWIPDVSKEGTGGTFSGQKIQMIWDFSEANVFRAGPAEIEASARWVARAIESTPRDATLGVARQAEAQRVSSAELLISTDPPYGDNIGYAALSDYFYVWLRPTLRDMYADLFNTLATPKDAELVAEPARHDNSDRVADEFFRQGMESVFREMASTIRLCLPISIFYAFKQAETTAADGTVSTGWETFLDGMIRSGWQITATWPMRMERTGRARDIASNALASSIVIAARVRLKDAPTLDLRGFRAMLHAELPEALRRMQLANIEPVDMQQAAIGPGIAIYSRYSKITLADGSAMPVRQALSIINEILAEVLDEELEGVDAETRWCVKWAQQYGWNTGPFSDAETLFKTTGTSKDGLRHAGVIHEGAGKVRLLGQSDLPPRYDPVDDDQPTVWEGTLHLSKKLTEQGIEAAGAFLARVEQAGVEIDAIKALAYRLYDICERKKWSAWALPFNHLVQAWPELTDAMARSRQRSSDGEQTAAEFDDADTANT